MQRVFISSDQHGSYISEEKTIDITVNSINSGSSYEEEVDDLLASIRAILLSKEGLPGASIHNLTFGISCMSSDGVCSGTARIKYAQANFKSVL